MSGQWTGSDSAGEEHPGLGEGEGKRRRPTIAEWKAGDAVKAYVYLTDVERKTTGRTSRWTATVQDASGAIAAVDWNGILADMPSRSFAAIAGDVGEYREKQQLTLVDCRVVDPEIDGPRGFDEALVIPSAPESREDLFFELRTADLVLSREAGELWAACFERYGASLSVWPASQKLHHAYRSGLMQHVVEMVRMAEDLRVTLGLDPDVLFLGILFHDLGKIEELGPMPGDPYTLRGKSEGHIQIGARMWLDIAANASAPLRDHVLHLILSHHGSLEHGSPVEPMTREAYVLHLLDMMSSRLEMIRVATRDLKPGAAAHYHPLGYVLGAWPSADPGAENALEKG